MCSGGGGVLSTFVQFIGFEYGALLIAYYPIKLIVLFVNRYKKNKWEWPIGF